MKKTLCLLLAALMLLSLCACGQSAAPAADDAAPAEADAPEAAEEVPEEVPATPEPEPLEPYAPYETKYGFRFEYPEEYQNLKGELLWHIFPFGYGQADVELFYIEVPEGERAAFREKAAADKHAGGGLPAFAEGYKRTCLFSMQALYDDEESVQYYETITPAEYLSSFYGEPPEDLNTRTEIPVYRETVRFYNKWALVVQGRALYSFKGEAAPIEESFRYMDEEYRDELLMLRDHPELFVSGLKEADWDLPGEVGDKVSFETTTLQGDTITSEELFAGHKVTMVNIWATWCGPCVNEMPELQKLNDSLAEKGCQVVGICFDATNDNYTAEALEIMDQCGVSYPNIHFTSDMNWAGVSTFPTSFFISEDGTILSEPVVGAYVSAYPRLFNDALAKVG